MLTIKKKTHTILKFKQEHIEPYIEPNTDLQREPEKEGSKIKKTS